MVWKRLAPVAIVVVLLGGAVGYGVHVHNVNTTPTSTPTPTVSATPIQDVSYQGVAGQTAMAVLKSKYTVDTKHYSFGDTVQGINGHEADDAHYWAFYVNGTLSDVGADAYTTKSTDTIEWKYSAL